MLEAERSRRGDEVGELVDTVKAYATQETVGPLKGVVRSLGFGLAGVVCLGVGLVLLVVALLRLLQTETSAFEGDWTSLVPYAIALVVTLVVIVVALSQIRKVDLDREEPRS